MKFLVSMVAAAALAAGCSSAAAPVPTAQIVYVTATPSLAATAPCAGTLTSAGYCLLASPLPATGQMYTWDGTYPSMPPTNGYGSPVQQPSVQPTTGASFAEFTAEFDVFYSGSVDDVNTLDTMFKASDIPGAQVRATKMAIDSNTFVGWLEANPPQACYLALYSQALTAAQDWGAGATLWETWGSGDWRPAFDQGQASFQAASPLLESVRAQMATVSCP